MKKSPFPGMDPYLQKHWADVHTALMGYIRDALQPQLAEDLIARMEESVFIEDESDRFIRKPDVRVVESPPPWTPSAGSTVSAVLDEPVMLEPTSDPLKLRSVVIFDAEGDRIVTAIEVLSPWNKSPGKPLDVYMNKRRQYLEGGVNLVEIDLIRAGDWRKMIGDYHVPPELRTTYRVTVSQPDKIGPYLYAISMGSRLPRFKVPLRPQDPPAVLDLQALLDKAYEMGRYYRIDYSAPCDPPFSAAEQVWVDSVLNAGK